MGHTADELVRRDGLWLVLLDGVEARLGSRLLSLGPPQRRAVLCALAFRPRQWVSPATLLAALYDDDVPASGIRVIQTYVSALRRILEPDRDAQCSPTVLVSGHGGYQLRVDDENIDLAVFNRLVNEAARLREQGAWQQAAQNYEQALALCGDEPLAGIPGPYAELQRAALTERRLGVLEDHLDLAVSLGRAAQAVDQLRTMIAEHPLRERPRAVLMRALYSRGRQAEALKVYAQARHVMIEHLGVEPSTELRALHSLILAGETVPSESVESAPPVTVTPADSALPMVGRERALRRLAGVATQARQGQGGLVLVSGPRGYGKTRVLIETAQREPDFRLVDLSAAGRNGRPADLPQALGAADSPAAQGDQPLADRILKALTDVAGGAPLLLLVDNIVHTDEQTVRVLSLLATRLRTTPILLVLAMDGSPWAGADTDVNADGYTALEAEATAVIRLGGLDESAVADLVTQETGRPCPPTLAAEIHQATVGIPQLVRALITDLETLPERQSVPHHLPGSGYARALGQLLGHYSPGAADVLRALAVLHSHHPTVDLIAAVIDASATEVRYHIEFHATCGLLATTHPPAFRHPLIANTLRWSCGRQAVDTMWLAAAHHARSTGQPARKIASYLRELTNASGAHWVPVLLEAAHECLREDATQEAMGHLETALRIVPQAGRTDLLIRVAKVEQWIDPVTAQTHLEEALFAQRESRSTPTATMPLVWLTSRQGHVEAALALLDEVIAETDPATATALRASTWMIAARTPSTWARFLSRTRAQAPDPITMAVLALDDTFAVRYSAQQVLDRFPAEHNDNQDWDRLPRELISVLANITLYADDLTSTLQLCDRDADHHFASLDLYRLIMRAEALCRRGQFAVVLREFELLESTPLGGAGRRPIGIVAQYAHALIGCGRIDDAERWLDSVTDHTHDSSWEWTMAKYARGLVHSARGSARDAAACFLDCGRRTAAWGMHNPGFMPWRSSAAVELHKIGEHHRARELATAELGIAQRWAAPRTLGLAWRAVALTSADETKKVPLLEQAAEHLRRSESVIELVRTLIILADAHAEAGSPQWQQAVLDEARALAEPTDAGHLLAGLPDHRC